MRRTSTRSRWFLGFLVSLMVVGCIGAGQAAPTAKPPAGRWVEEFRSAGLAADTEWVTMRDGTRLAATVAKPFLGTRFPAILIRTPYGRDQLEIAATLIPLSGYVLVIQDMRGRFDSEGEDRVFQDDGWGENFVLGDVPAGAYILKTVVNRKLYTYPVEVVAGQTAFVEIEIVW